MKSHIKIKKIRESLEEWDDSFGNYEPSSIEAGKEMGNAYIRKITNRLNYIINNLLHKGLVGQETTDMFPDDSNIDYFCLWSMEVNIEKQTIEFKILECLYQKAVMIPFIDTLAYE